MIDFVYVRLSYFDGYYSYSDFNQTLEEMENLKMSKIRVNGKTFNEKIYNFNKRVKAIGKLNLIQN